MRALQIRGNGHDQLVLCDVPVPRPAPGEVLLRVETVGVNHLDQQVIKGIGPGAGLRYPRILGIDPSGTIVGQGGNLDLDMVGRRVVVKPNISCGACPRCQVGHEADCDQQSVVGVHRDGGAAEYVTVPARNVFSIDGIEFDVASAAIHSVPIALHALNAAGPIIPGMRVLVTGASGSVGAAAVQLARHLGSTVVSTSRSTIDFGDGRPEVRFEDVSKLPDLLKSNFGPMDVAIDCTGDGAVVAAAVKCLGWLGTAVFFAALPGSKLLVDSRDFYLRRKRLMGVASANYAEVEDALKLVRLGHVTPKVARHIDLNDAISWYGTPGKRSGEGKVIIDVS